MPVARRYQLESAKESNQEVQAQNLVLQEEIEGLKAENAEFILVADKPIARVAGHEWSDRVEEWGPS